MSRGTDWVVSNGINFDSWNSAEQFFDRTDITLVNQSQ
jgi:hypothetical protein